MNYGDVPVVFVILKSFKLRGECGDFGLDCLEVRVLGLVENMRFWFVCNILNNTF